MLEINLNVLHFLTNTTYFLSCETAIHATRDLCES